MKSKIIVKMTYGKIFSDRIKISSLLKDINIKESLVFISTINKFQYKIQDEPNTEIRFILNKWLEGVDEVTKRKILESFSRLSIEINDRSNRDSLSDGIVVVNRTSSLRVLEILSSQRINDTHIDNTPNNRLNLFKLYLLVNDEISLRQDSIFEKYFRNRTDSKDEIYFNLFLGITQPFQRYSRVEYLWPEVLKFFLFEKWLRNNSQYLDMSKDYLKVVGLNSWEEYFNDVFRISQLATDNPVIFKSDYPVLDNILRYFESRNDYSPRWSEFVNIKKRPVVKLDKERYVVLDFEFLLVKFFSSVYHDLLEYSKTYKTNTFSQDYNKDFIEDVLLNSTFKMVFGNSYIRYSEKLIKSKGGKKIENLSIPDYYIRNGSKTILIECKNSFISNYNKISLDTDELLNEIKTKFYLSIDPKNSKQKSRAVLQLINFIRQSLLGNYQFFDGVKNSKKLVYYPVLLVTDLTLTSIGFNKLLNTYFREELNNSELEDLEKIKDLTIIHIDDFYIHQTRLKNLTTLIVKYHKYIRNCKGIDSMISFTDYLSSVLFIKRYNTQEKDIKHIIEDSLLPKQ